MLAAALLGPSAAVVVLSAVLIVQCLLFADGGVTALGANVFNMAIVGTVGGWAIYELVRRAVGGPFGRVVGATFAGWCGTVLAAVACAGELAAGHAVSVVGRVAGDGGGAHGDRHRRRGDHGAGAGGGGRAAAGIAGPAGPAATRSVRPVLIYGLLITAGLALFVSPFACQWPDGLEKVAQGLGFAQRATEAVVPAVADEYRVPGVGSTALATGLAAGLGMVVMLGVAWVLARALVPRRGRRRCRSRRPQHNRSAEADPTGLMPGRLPEAVPGGTTSPWACVMMDMDFLDRFSRLDSPVHRLSAATKLVAALVMIVGVVAVPMRGAVLLLSRWPCCWS